MTEGMVCIFCKRDDCLVVVEDESNCYNYGTYYVTCTNCGCQGPEASSKEEAIKLWLAAFDADEAID